MKLKALVAVPAPDGKTYTATVDINARVIAHVLRERAARHYGKATALYGGIVVTLHEVRRDDSVVRRN